MGREPHQIFNSQDLSTSSLHCLSYISNQFSSEVVVLNQTIFPSWYFLFFFVTSFGQYFGIRYKHGVGYWTLIGSYIHSHCMVFIMFFQYFLLFRPVKQRQWGLSRIITNNSICQLTMMILILVGCLTLQNRLLSWHIPLLWKNIFFKFHNSITS